MPRGTWLANRKSGASETLNRSLSMPLTQRVWSFVLRTALVAAVFSGATLTASAQAHYEGTAGPGSLYEIDVPANWNGDLVLYAHGIVEASLPVRPPTTQDGYNIPLQSSPGRRLRCGGVELLE
jgi:hypothetical protein